MNKLTSLVEKLEARKVEVAETKGAVSLETIIVTAAIIALIAVLVTLFATSVKKAGNDANGKLESNATKAIDSAAGTATDGN